VRNETRKFVGSDGKNVPARRGVSFGEIEVCVIGARVPLTFLVSANTLENFPTRSSPGSSVSLFSALFASRPSTRKEIQRAGGCLGRSGKAEKERERERERDEEARRGKGRKIERLAEEKEARIQMLMKLTRRALIWPLQIFAKRLK